MATTDDETTNEERQVTLHVKSSSEAKYTLTVPRSMTVLELKSKLSTSDLADLPPDRQRLIYSGRVLKDGDTLDSYKVQDGHTIHLVKSAASNQRQTAAAAGVGRGTPAAASGADPTSNVPRNLASGPGNNPLVGLTGARYAGLAQLPGAQMFGPDGGMGAPPDAESVMAMLSDPHVASSLNEALSNSDVVDTMINQNPMLRELGPVARQMLQSEEFRRMLTDPNALRGMTQMTRSMGMGPFGPGGLAGGPLAFPAPGATNTSPAAASSSTPANADAAGGPPTAIPGLALAMAPGALTDPDRAFLHMLARGPLAGAPPGAAAAANPFAALFGGPGPTPAGAAGSEGGTAAPQPPNLFPPSRTMLESLAALGGGGMVAPGPPPPPADLRPPEERYEQQLRQLNDMGFYDFDQNVAALRRSGGNVEGAVEHLLRH
ncbi:MAG: hypothetical protein M1826_007280 [Phylliscum demangeonii]|nr:MAG: hypothetical protein M1826_007280 [Phylliscum demangeonii]